MDKKLLNQKLRKSNDQLTYWQLLALLYWSLFKPKKIKIYNECVEIDIVGKYAYLQAKDTK